MDFRVLSEAFSAPPFSHADPVSSYGSDDQLCEDDSDPAPAELSTEPQTHITTWKTQTPHHHRSNTEHIFVIQTCIFSLELYLGETALSPSLLGESKWQQGCA